MTQAQLEREVCRATGESRDLIRRVGFQFLPMPRLVIPPRQLLKFQVRQRKHAMAAK